MPLPAGAVARSLSGEVLYPQPMSPEARAKHLQQLHVARSNYDADPTDEMNIIWLGRRQAYLGRYRAAVDTFSRGLALHPQSARLLRHRGHRRITLRDLDGAVRDLERAARLIADQPDVVEPDGLPNAQNIPTSTLHTNVYYHLGLARYLRGEFDRAADAYGECVEIAANRDMESAARYWLYLSLMRADKAQAAAVVLEPVKASWKIIENRAYHDLLLLYKGERTVAEVTGAEDESVTGPGVNDATVLYGVAMYHWMRGDAVAAQRTIDVILTGEAWAAFGYIAAEAERARGTLTR